MCWPGSLNHFKKGTYSLRTVHHRKRQARHNCGTRLTSCGSGIRTCDHPLVQTSIPWTSSYGSSWAEMSARPQTAAPPSWSRLSRRHGPISARTRCGALVYQWLSVWRLSSGTKVAILRPSDVACMSTCLEIHVRKRFPISWYFFKIFKVVEC